MSAHSRQVSNTHRARARTSREESKWARDMAREREERRKTSTFHGSWEIAWRLRERWSSYLTTLQQRAIMLARAGQPEIRLGCCLARRGFWILWFLMMSLCEFCARENGRWNWSWNFRWGLLQWQREKREILKISVGRSSSHEIFSLSLIRQTWNAANWIKTQHLLDFDFDTMKKYPEHRSIDRFFFFGVYMGGWARQALKTYISLVFGVVVGLVLWAVDVVCSFFSLNFFWDFKFLPSSAAAADRGPYRVAQLPLDTPCFFACFIDIFSLLCCCFSLVVCYLFKWSTKSMWHHHLIERERAAIIRYKKLYRERNAVKNSIKISFCLITFHNSFFSAAKKQRILHQLDQATYLSGRKHVSGDSSQQHTRHREECQESPRFLAKEKNGKNFDVENSWNISCRGLLLFPLGAERELRCVWKCVRKK